MLKEHLSRHKLDYALSLMIICLSALIVQRRFAATGAAQPKGDIGGGGVEARENVTADLRPPVAATAVSYSRDIVRPSSLERITEATAGKMPYKPAVRLVELGDAVLVSLAVRDIATNAVQIALTGSTLKILTHHILADQTTAAMENSIMLPVAVDAGSAPTYRLEGDLLQVRVSKATAGTK